MTDDQLRAKRAQYQKQLDARIQGNSTIGIRRYSKREIEIVERIASITEELRRRAAQKDCGP